MTLAVLGAGGQVGRALVERAGAAARGFERAACDICDPRAVGRVLAPADVSVVINCAAYTAVDRAEQEPARAFAVNRDGAANVARMAAERHLPVIHLSTDYVYSGTGTAPLDEATPIAPLNVYGASKAAGDAAVAAADAAHLLLRVSWVFGVYGANFVKTMRRLGRQRSELRIVDDQHGGPTEARDIADAILVMAAACQRPGFNDWGIYHFAGAPSVSWCSFAAAIFDLSDRPTPSLVKITSREYPAAARRPLNSTLDCNRIRRFFGIGQPDWRKSLARVITELDRTEQ